MDGRYQLGSEAGNEMMAATNWVGKNPFLKVPVFVQMKPEEIRVQLEVIPEVDLYATPKKQIEVIDYRALHERLKKGHAYVSPNDITTSFYLQCRRNGFETKRKLEEVIVGGNITRLFKVELK
jgi:hypothetical protein